MINDKWRIKMMSLMALLFCSVLTVNAYAGCQQLIVAEEPQPSSNWTITDYTFQYTEGNGTYKICGTSAYGITKSKMGMWIDLTVENASVTLEIYAKINLTDSQGIVRPYYLNHTQYYAVGNSPVHLISKDNYYVGTYRVVAIGAKKI